MKEGAQQICHFSQKGLKKQVRGEINSKTIMVGILLIDGIHCAHWRAQEIGSGTFSRSQRYASRQAECLLMDALYL
jgi:hypothetical protein